MDRKNTRKAIILGLIILVGFFIARQTIHSPKREKINEAKMLRKFGKKLKADQKTQLAAYIESVNAQSISKKKKRKLIKEKRASFKHKKSHKKE